MRNALLVLHILAVAAWLGANLALAFASSSTRGAAPEVRSWWAAVQGQMSRVYYNVAVAVVLLTGVGLVLLDDSPVEFSDLFVGIGFLAVILGFVFDVFVFSPGCRTLVDAIDSGDESREHAANNRLATVGLVDSLVVVVAIVAMVARWN